MKIPIMLLWLILLAPGISAQQKRTVTIIGAARSLISNNDIRVHDSLPDTVTVKRNTGGYALIDLGVDICPNKSVEILGMFRIKNDFGGFWGAGVSFDVRQLWLKGIIANVVRYQVGDLNLKQTPFTLYNHHADQIDSLPDVFNLQNQIIWYEKYYIKNTWRQQGACVDFGLNFRKYIKEIDFMGYMTRLNATDFVSVPDRLMGGASINVLQGRHVSFGYNGFWVFDVKGTTPDSTAYNNSVNTVDIGYMQDVGSIQLEGRAEAGISKAKYAYDTAAPKLSDYFVYAYAVVGLPRQHLEFTVGYLNVGPDFRSIGAQSKDIDYAAAPDYYNYYSNAQISRPLSLFDLIRNENLYKTGVTSKLMTSDPVYNNVLPYGIATFNRQGAYVKIDYAWPDGITVNAESYLLSEIRGQGTFNLKTFSQSRVLAEFDINRLAHFSRMLKVQLGANYQTTWRTGGTAVENVDLRSFQYQAGIAFEVIKKLDLMAGIVGLYNNGNDFIPVRNAYTTVDYFTPVKYDLSQYLAGFGIRFRFTDKIYLCALYQFTDYNDRLKTYPGYGLDQFGLIFNMTY